MKKARILWLILTMLIAGNALIAQDSIYSFHYQLTCIEQGHGRYRALYSGTNSLNPNPERALSLTTTLFVGRKLWKYGSLYFNPEIMGGNGMSKSRGIAGFPNGETFRIDNSDPRVYVARLFYRQYIPFRNTGYDTVQSEFNQIKEIVPASRLQFTFGKFSIVDFFDKSIISHDPRVDFMNWSLMSNAGWDYPANTRGYTEGFVVEMIKPMHALRFSICKVPTWANGPDLDPHILKANSFTLEGEQKYKMFNQNGTFRLLFTYTRSKAPKISDVVNNYISGVDTSLDIINSNKYGGKKYGYAASWEHSFTPNLTMLIRNSWNDGRYATWAFTEVDASSSVLFRKYKIFTDDDNFGLAFVKNDLSADHIRFYQLGGYGFMIGDGKLNYSPEMIMETFYKINYNRYMSLTFDYQYVINPAYNKDRGPVSVYAMRVHIEI